MNPTEKEIELLKGIKSEIAASGTLNMISERDKGYNEGIFKAVEIVKRYMRGDGIFQIDTN
jgi:hypothetical protein